MSRGITGRTASEIADSVRGLLERGMLRAGDPLPPVRTLAADLGINRNTAVAAYRQLTLSGVVETRGRAGTRVVERSRVAEEGYGGDAVLRDVGTGNPDPRRIPDLRDALARVAGHPVLYGEPVVDPALEYWASEWMKDDLAPADPRVTITSGAADAVERLLAQALTPGDAVALEDPCFLTSRHTVRLGGYRAVPVAVDEEGMTVAGLRAALADGVRAVICTPRAHNPTGAGLSAERAADLRAALAAHPYVLVIEDDHFSLLSQRPFHSLIGHEHERYALIRSVSKFLGPDMCLAMVATDAETSRRLSMRLSPGTTWVSHLLQRLVLAQLADDDVRRAISRAGAHYAAQNADFAARLRARGIDPGASDGLNVWVPVGAPAAAAAARLEQRGWRTRSGEDFRLTDPAASTHLRLTVHDLDDDDASRLADDLAWAASA